MSDYLGDFPTSGKVSFLWNTNAIAGEFITRATDGTLKIFKTNATASTWATERSSLAGVTQLEDFDATGMHSVYIDLSDNTDASFYAAGNEYQVAIVGAVVDGKTMNVPLAAFSIERAGGVLAYLKAGSVVAASVTGAVGSVSGHTAQTGDTYALANGASGFVALKGYVDDIGAAGAGLTGIPWNSAWDAEVESEVNDAIVVQRLDELLNADSDIDGAAPPTVGSVFHELMTKTPGSFTYDQTTDALEALRDRGDAAWVTGAGGDPWATALPGAYGDGTAGKIVGDNINATISSRMATYTQPTGFLAASFPTDPADQSLIIAATDAIIAAIAALNNLSQANIRTAIGLGSANLDTQLGDLPTNTELATALAAADDAVLAAIAALNNLSAATVKAQADQALVDYDGPTNTELSAALAAADDAVLAAIAALNNISAAQVNAEMLDVLNVDTFAEPTGAPAATASLVVKLGRLHQALRNGLTVTATDKTFNDDAGAALWKKALSDSGTEYAEGEGTVP